MRVSSRWRALRVEPSMTPGRCAAAPPAAGEAAAERQCAVGSMRHPCVCGDDSGRGANLTSSIMRSGCARDACGSTQWPLERLGSRSTAHKRLRARPLHLPLTGSWASAVPNSPHTTMFTLVLNTASCFVHHTHTRTHRGLAVSRGVCAAWWVYSCRPHRFAACLQVSTVYKGKSKVRRMQQHSKRCDSR